MTHLHDSAPDIALVRTLSSFEWDYKDRGEMLERISLTGASVINILASQDRTESTYVIPILNDDRIGRTAFYLDNALREQGRDAKHVSSQALSREIQKSRLDASRDNVASSLARICQLTKELSDWDDSSRLVLVTSEPFMLGARRIDTGISPEENRNTIIEPGEVIGVHSSAFDIT